MLYHFIPDISYHITYLAIALTLSATRGLRMLGRGGERIEHTVDQIPRETAQLNIRQ